MLLPIPASLTKHTSHTAKIKTCHSLRNDLSFPPRKIPDFLLSETVTAGLPRLLAQEETQPNTPKKPSQRLVDKTPPRASLRVRTALTLA